MPDRDSSSLVPTSEPRETRVDSRLKAAIESGNLPKELLICGPAGTGKTFGLLSVLHTILADYPGVRALMVRQTRTSLTHSVLPTYEEEVLPLDGMSQIAAGCSRKVRESYRYPHPRGKYSELVLGGLDKPERVLSSAWDIIYVNEAIEITEPALDALTGRLNRPGRPSWLGWLLADTNPGDPLHHIKKRCDEGRMALWDTVHRANPAMYQRGEWTPAGLAYLGRLETLRGTRRKRYLDGIWCAGEGLWFDGFSAEQHVTDAAEYDPDLPVMLPIDSGVYTGAVAFQRRPMPDGPDLITVFFDYLSEGLSARVNAEAIRAGLAGRNGVKRKPKVTTDPAGGARNPIGPTVMAEYEAVGLKAEPWPGGSVADGLALIEGLLTPVGTTPRLLIHPRCKHLITAMANYRRKKRAGQMTDQPEDPQHPHEDLVDALRGGLREEFPDGLKKATAFKRRTIGQQFY